MNKKRIEEMIPKAMDELKTIGILDDDGRLPSNYSRYIDSYGPTIRQSGLMQAVTFNEKEKREKINSLIKLVLEKRGYIETTSNKKLIDIVKEASNNSEEKAKLQRLILEAITAGKHAMRTFPKIIVKDSD
jgi:CRISPR/Cas system CMR-associated protein Cmr5 small subunit